MLITRVVQAFLCGLADALKLHKSIVFLLTSKPVRVRVLECFVLNGVIFLGGLFVITRVVRPILYAMMRMEEADPLQELGTLYVDSLVQLSKLLWLYPVYSLSFILNAIWYQDIADNAYIICGGVRRAPDFSVQRWINTMAEEVYRLLLIGSYVLQMSLCAYIPLVGNAVCLVHLAWLYSLYSFEYKVRVCDALLCEGIVPVPTTISLLAVLAL
jgi:etoposide-induced 2.4 mRNA